ncbi:hypothetical protein T484DRAFT_1858846, partial [Baffinella frigidus]
MQVLHVDQPLAERLQALSVRRILAGSAVLHVDQPFAERLQGLYARRIMAGSAVLDLGASCATFLPED